MEAWRVARSRIRGLFAKRGKEKELDAELRAHLELLREENMRRGMSPEEARYAARREFGGVEQTKEHDRDQGGLSFLEPLIRDLSFALRLITTSAVFALVAVVTLAVGVGAATAGFSVVYRLL